MNENNKLTHDEFMDVYMPCFIVDADKMIAICKEYGLEIEYPLATIVNRTHRLGFESGYAAAKKEKNGTKSLGSPKE